MPQHSHRYFRNTDCEYFPCHKGADPERFNCLFCFCPLYWLEDCGGKPSFAKGVKDCTACRVPHDAGGYDHVIARLREEFARRRPAQDTLQDGADTTTDTNDDTIRRTK